MEQEIKTYPKEVLDKLKGDKGFMSQLTKSKATVRGALVGTGAGWLLASYFKLPKIVGMITGFMGGVVFADAISSHIEKLKTCKIKNEQNTTNDAVTK